MVGWLLRRDGFIEGCDVGGLVGCIVGHDEGCREG